MIDDARAAAYYPYLHRQQLPVQHLAQFRRLVEEILPVVLKQVLAELSAEGGR